MLTVFRFEDENGVGPYQMRVGKTPEQVRLAKLLGKLHSHEADPVRPSVDLYALPVSANQVRVGMTSPEGLLQWFGQKGVIQRLHRCGYRLAQYRIEGVRKNRDKTFSRDRGQQVVFALKSAERLQVPEEMKVGEVER